MAAEPKKQIPLRLNAKLYEALAAWALNSVPGARTGRSLPAILTFIVVPPDADKFT